MGDDASSRPYPMGGSEKVRSKPHARLANVGIEELVMGDTTHDDDRPSLADRIRQAPTLEDAIREVLEDDSLTPADNEEGAGPGHD